MKQGDYSVLGHRKRIGVERKTLTDFFGSIGRGHKRFFRSLDRLAALPHKLLVIETEPSRLFNPETHRYSRLKRSHVLGSIVSILADRHIPIVCVDTRFTGEEVVYRFLARSVELSAAIF